MTAADVLERQAATLPGVPDCQAMIPVTCDPDELPALMRCPEPPVARVEGRCPHGHVREGWLCGEHAEQLGLSGCRACLEDERLPHGCPLTVRRITGDGRG